MNSFVILLCRANCKQIKQRLVKLHLVIRTHTLTLPKPLKNTSFYFQIATSKQARNLYIFLFFFIVSANEYKHNNKHKIAKEIVRLGVVFNLTSKSIYVETKKVKQIFTFEHYFFKQHTQHYLTKLYFEFGFLPYTPI